MQQMQETRQNRETGIEEIIAGVFSYYDGTNLDTENLKAELDKVRAAQKADAPKEFSV